MNRYQYTKKDKNNRYINTNLPNVDNKKSDNDIYIITKYGDTFQGFAYKYYNDVSLWWIIAKFNKISADSQFIEIGTQIIIPYNYKKIISDLKNNNS